MVGPKLRHYYHPDYYVKDYSYKPHLDLFINVGPIRLGSTIRCVATFYDETGVFEDPNSAPTIHIYDPDGTAQVTAQTMTEDSDYTSTYYYNYDLSTSGKAGLWRFKVTATLTIDSNAWDYDQSMPFQVFKELG